MENLAKAADSTLQEPEPGWIEAEWGGAQADFRTWVEALNKRIRALNLEVPSPAFQRPLVRAEQEIERVKGGL